MKLPILAIFMILLSACKSEQKDQAVVGTTTLKENQIELTADANNSAAVQSFAENIQRRQAEKPDQMFEVVRSQKSSSTSTILSSLSDNHLYTNKNFYIFIGLGSTQKDETIQKTDWDAIYSIMNYVSGLKFRVLINVQATGEHLRLASQDADTAVILWSSHGNTTGFYDYNGNIVPYKVFKNKNPNFYQFILSSCEGRIALRDKYEYSNLVTWSWSGLTTSADLRSFLVSDKWSAQDGKSLSTPRSNVTCTANGNKFSLMQTTTRYKLYGYAFGTLKGCEDRMATIANNEVCLAGEEGIKKISTLNLSANSEGYSSIANCLAQ